MDLSPEHKKTLFEIIKQKIRDEETHIAELIRKILDHRYETNLANNRIAQLKADLKELEKKEEEKDNTEDVQEGEPKLEPEQNNEG